MSSALDLVVLNGPLEGEIVQLRPNKRLIVGRSQKGLQLIDPLVSLNHAEIVWEGDRYWIQDLQSATGTYVNDVRLAEKAVVLVPGMRIRVGETDIEVRERPRSAALRIAGAAAAIFLLFVAVRSFMASIEVRYEPAIQWWEPVRQGGGYVSPILRIPTHFIRETGVDHRALKIESVTDHDGDGVDELWLSWPGGRRIVTFNPDGLTWRTLSDIGADCKPKGRPITEGQRPECLRADVASPVSADCAPKGGFPDLDCSGTLYRYDEREGYRIVEHDGVFTWMPPTKVIEKPAPAKSKSKGKTYETLVVDGPPQPFLFTLVRPSNLAGFLVERGISEPIHYLVCEEALPGSRAQVLTQRGEIVPLSVGCIGDVVVEGPTRAADFGDGTPRMFAFTGTGYRQLLEDVAVYLSGNRDRLFMSGADHRLYESLAAPPVKRKGAIRVGFEGPERIFDPIAKEGPIPGGHQLLAAEFSRGVPPRSHTITLDSDGPKRYPMEGCGELEVRPGDWHCLFTKGCGEKSTFLTVQNVGCGAPGKVWEIPYGNNLYTYEDAFYEGRIRVDSIDQDGQIDVLRVRITYRPKAQAH